MKSIVLENISIRNFKGFKEYDLKVDGNSLDIKGANSTGKSSVYDAFMYCLFGKDSHNSTKFKWKPIDVNNEEIHHLQTEVTLELLVDGKKETLTRITKEKWPKGVFDGNESTYLINEIKTTLNKYNKHIESIIDTETFKQLTNIYYIAEVMDVKERREFLFDLVGNMTDQDVIDSNPELKELPSILEDREIDDRRTLLKQEQTKVTGQIKESEYRMDEQQLGLIDLTGLDKEELAKEKTALSSKANYIHEEISIIRNGNQKTALLADVQTKKAELNTLRSEHAIKENEKLTDLQQEKNDLYGKAMDAQSKCNGQLNSIELDVKKIDAIKYVIDKNEKEMAKLREKYAVVSKQEFAPLLPFEPMETFDEHQLNCQFCGQEYPESQKEEVLEKYETEKELHQIKYDEYKKDYDERLVVFNIERAEQLENISVEGKKLAAESLERAAEIKELESFIEKEEIHLASLESERDELNKQHDEVQAAMLAAKTKQVTFEETDLFADKTKEIAEIESNISKLDLESEQMINELKDQLNQINLEIQLISDEQDKFRMEENQRDRINELMVLNRKYSERSGEIKRQLNLIDLFTKTKVDLLTDKINSQFGLVTFRLFDTTKDGAVIEVCEPIYKGAPFTGALNSGHKVLAGIDIINTVSKLKGVKVPLFVDNAETVTEEVDFDLQLIMLRAVKGVKKLEVSVM